MKLGKNNFVVTFKTEDEVLEYFKMHNGEEQRLLWLGFFIANNYIAQRLEDEGMELAKPWPPKEKKWVDDQEHQWPGFTWAIGDGSSNRDQATSIKPQAASFKQQAWQD